MKILVLFSIGNRGKSETINILIDLLQQGGAEILATNHVPANRFRDRWCVMEYQVTYGSPYSSLSSGDIGPTLPRGEAFKASIGVTARESSARSGTVTARPLRDTIAAVPECRTTGTKSRSRLVGRCSRKTPGCIWFRSPIAQRTVGRFGRARLMRRWSVTWHPWPTRSCGTGSRCMRTTARSRG